MINRFLDKEGKLCVFPKKSKRVVIYDFLIGKFEKGREYTEEEVNLIIENNHSFNDICLLRRELIDNLYLQRIDDGSVYKRCK